MSFPKGRLDVALVHWPVFDRARKTVCTNVTNFDIHDIARASRTYGVRKYFIVNRMQEQLSFVSRVLDHWRLGVGSEYNPKRKTALGMIELVQTVEDALKTYEKRPLVVATSARDLPTPRIEFKELRERIWDEEGETLLIFGTGFGLGDQVLAQADRLLAPLKGASQDDYRHLSVRSAVSIVLDRLLGTW
ncbi:MAG: RNA methyltransferase [Bdellovibrionales bacterium]